MTPTIPNNAPLRNNPHSGNTLNLAQENPCNVGWRTFKIDSVLPERRNPQSGKLRGFRGKDETVTAAPLGRLYSTSVTIRNTVSKSNFARCVATTDRKSRFVIKKSGSDCAHCHPACEAAIGRPSARKDSGWSNPRELLSTRLPSGSRPAMAVIGLEPSQGKRAFHP